MNEVQKECFLETYIVESNYLHLRNRRDDMMLQDLKNIDDFTTSQYLTFS